MSTPTLDPVLVIDPSPHASTLTVPPITSAGCEVRTVTTVAEGLDVAASLGPRLVFVDARLPPPPVMRQPEAARLFGVAPLVLLAEVELDRANLEAWAGVGAIDCVIRPLRLHDVQLRLLAAKQGRTGEAPKAPRRVLVASDDLLDLKRLDSLLQLNGFSVQAVNLSERSSREPGACDVLVLAARSSATDLLRQLRNRAGLDEVPAVVLSVETTFPASAKVLATLSVNAQADEVVRALNGESRVRELRAHQRVPFYAPIEFRETGASRWLSGYTSNISPGGIFVRSLASLRRGAPLELRAHLAGRHETLAGGGVVAWANGWGARGAFHFSVGMGIQFVGMSPAAMQRVQQLCTG